MKLDWVKIDNNKNEMFSFTKHSDNEYVLVFCTKAQY